MRSQKNSLHLFIGTLFLLFTTVSLAQTTIKGTIVNSDSEEKIEGASLVLKKGDSIIGYTYSNQDGHYQLNTDQTGRLNLTCRSLGYRTKTKQLPSKAANEILSFDFKLSQQGEKLQEVVIETDRPIEERGDTIVFSAQYFTNGTERNVEELLKKIPGLTIDDQGTITIGNQEVEKVMVEEDDFFGKGYKLLTKNMPAFPIEKVEILQNYSNNKLLKGIEDSDKVALNLKLKEDAKRVWFGNLKVGMGNRDYYKAKGNLMNFGKRNKYYFLGSMNNMGQDVVSDISSLLYAQHGNEAGHIGDSERAKKLISLSGYTPDIGASRTNFNNDKLLSINSIFNPTDDLKVKPLLFFNWNRQDFYRQHQEAVNAEDTRFVNTENYRLYHKDHTLFGKLDILYDLSKHQTLKSITHYNSGHQNADADLVFNEKDIGEVLKAQNERLDQKLIYTNKFSSQNVFLLSGRLIKEQSPERYQVNQFYYQDLFPSLSQADHVKQYSRNDMLFMGINGHLLLKQNDGNLLELEFGNEYRSDELNTRFSVYEQHNLLDRPEGYQNHDKYKVNDFYLKGNYKYTFNNLAVKGKLDIHQLFNYLNAGEIRKTQHPFFINPRLGINWDLNADNSLNISYSLNNTNADILGVYSNYVLTGYRSFDKSMSDFEQLQASTALLLYQFGNWSDRFFANASITYIKNHDFFSTNTVVRQEYTQTQKLLIKNREMISANGQLNYFFNALLLNLKIKLGYSESDYKNIVNESEFRLIKSASENYGLEVRSTFNGIFNFHIGTSLQRSQIKSPQKNAHTDNQAFLDLYFQFDKRFDITLHTNYYYFGHLEKDKMYTFLDLEVNYDLIKDKLSLQLNGKNLFNKREFRTYNISDISTSTTAYRLLPRMMLLGVKYRF